MTELRRKELWFYLIISFAYVLSMLYWVMDYPMLNHRHVLNGSANDQYYDLIYYVPLLNVLKAILVLLIIGVVYFQLIPRYVKEVLGEQMLIISVVAFISILLVTSIYYYLQDTAYLPMRYRTGSQLVSGAFQKGLRDTAYVSFAFVIYITARTFLVNLYQRTIFSEKGKKVVLDRSVMVLAGGISSIIILLMFESYMHRVWVAMTLFLIPLYLLLFVVWTNLIFPAYEKNRNKKKLILWSVLSTLVITFPLYGLFTLNARFKSGSNEADFFLIFLLSLPLLWVILRIWYKDVVSKIEAMDELKLEVDTKTANIDFLRSQINPHFLFNALNTLYGLALTEKAERSAEGIQKLGDMMRFVLIDNQQQKISIDKEVDYISHFIDLQKLRTQASDKIVITFKKYSHDCNHQIAPMLLIPLIENAFKHGISLTQPSWITINLTCDDHKVYLDVYNSVHPKSEGDTEKYSNGIGLRNVQQRLSLLYPDKHELQIRHTPHEYIVHLTIEP